MDSDDDFGDFGGFEAAEPVAPAEAQPLPAGFQAIAGPSTWAVLPDVPGAAPAPLPGAQPDVIIHAATGGVDSGGKSAHESPAGASTAVDQTPCPWRPGGFSNIDDNSSGTDWAALGEDIHQGTAVSLSDLDIGGSASGTPRMSEVNASVVDLAPGSEDLKQVDTGNSASGPSATEILATNGSSHQHAASDLDLDFDVDLDLGPNAQTSSTASSSAPAAVVTATPCIRVPHQPLSEGQTLTNGDVEPQTLPNAATNDQTNAAMMEMQNLLQARIADQEKLEDVLRGLTRTKADLECSLEECKEQLLREREKYNELQEAHSTQLDEIRKAGQSALTVIVEEYKELCKVAVLEQHENSQRSLLETLKKETERHQDTMKAQEAISAAAVEQCRQSAETRLTEGLERSRLEHEAAMEKLTAAERQKSEDALQVALKAQHEERERRMREVLEEERRRTSLVVQEEQTKAMKLLEEERERGAKSVTLAVDEGRRHWRECLSVALDEERQRGERLKGETLEQAREETRKQLAEQKQADDRLRHRSLVSMDLLLEGVRQQLNSLLQSSKDPPNLNSVDDL